MYVILIALLTPITTFCRHLLIWSISLTLDTLFLLNKYDICLLILISLISTQLMSMNDNNAQDCIN